MHFLEVGEVVEFATVSDGMDKISDNPEADPRVRVGRRTHKHGKGSGLARS